MACSCHGKNGVSVTKTNPNDQCTTCAKKHVVKAWNLYNEFTYTDDNRDTISGQLRLAVDHLAIAHRNIALKARDLAIIIEENRDNEISDEWEVLLREIRDAYYADHPDARLRLENMKS